MRAYRAALEARETRTHAISLALPPLAIQRALNRLAGTDLPVRLAYQDSVAAYHEALKQFFYPLVFENKRVSDVSFSAVPRHSFRPEPMHPDWLELVCVCALAALLMTLAVVRARKLDC